MRCCRGFPSFRKPASSSDSGKATAPQNRILRPSAFRQGAGSCPSGTQSRGIRMFTVLHRVLLGTRLIASVYIIRALLPHQRCDLLLKYHMY